MASAFAFNALTLIAVSVSYGAHSTDTANQTSIPPQSKEVDLADLVVVVLSQPQHYHVKRAELFRQHFEQQLTGMAKADQPELLLTHERWPNMQGAWTIFPIATTLAQQYGDKRWVVVCEEETRMDLQRLLLVLRQNSEKDDPFLGRALRDAESTVIHHFAFFEDPSSFTYPDFSAGMALAMPLIKRLADKFSSGGDQRIHFSIDAKHELAKFILDKLEIRLTHVCELCGTATSESKDCQCATWQPVRFPTDCGPPVGQQDLFVAVKTCSKFHQDRVPVVQQTWGKEAALIQYYSDEEDSDIPTINLGVPNTDRGHCGKTEAILKHFAKSEQLSSVPWLLIADDDTIINIKLLLRLLPCYESSEPVFLGERYGYSVAYEYGYNYITGGGGMVFNRPAVEQLAAEFSCPSDDSPDDMMLGIFFSLKEIHQTHSRYFHQARPEDYSKDFLSTQIPVSFHKHWNNDPYEVYKRLKVEEPPFPSPSLHEEL